MFWDDDIGNVEGAKEFGFDANQFLDVEKYEQTINSRAN